MNSLLPQTSLLVQSLGWALLQSLWQGLLIYTCLRIVLALSPKSARLRYLLSMLSLTTMFAWFLDTWVEQWLMLRNITVFITQAGTELARVKTTPLTAIEQTAFNNSNILGRLLSEVQPYLPLAVGLYLLGLFFMMARFGISIYEVRKLRRKGITIPPDDLTNWLQHKKDQLLISRPVQLFYSIYAKVPMTVGNLRPVILMPIAMAGSLSTEQLEAILLHELAHIKRNDYLLNIFQAIAETALFFNPFVWLASSIIRREREHCCDDLVLSCSAGPLPYAKALAALEAYRMQANKLALAATGNKNRLFHRIKRIMEMKKQKNNYATAIIATLVIAALVISIAWFSPSFAQSKKSKSKTPAPTSRSTTTITTTTRTSNTRASKAHEAEAAETPEPPEAPDAPEAFEAPEAPEPPEAPEAGLSPIAPIAPIDIDWDEMNKDMKRAKKEMTRATANVDWDQINREMEKANKEMERANKEMAVIDWKEINREMANAQKELDAVDWKEIQQEIDKGLQEARRSIKDPKVRKQVEQSLAIAQKQSEAAIKQAHIAIRQAQLNAENQRKSHSSYNVSVSSSGAGSGNANVYSKGNGYGYSYGSTNSTKAHTSGSYEIMLSKMEHDGLMNRSKSYKVEKYTDRLYINGQLQPGDVYNRYSKYLKGKDLTIKGDRDHIKINVKD